VPVPTTIPPAYPLPSQSSAAALVSGDLSAAPMVLAHLLGRAALIGVGFAIVGERDAGRLVGGSIAGSAMIELFVLIHELTNQRT
jgi:hypothetical protein